MNTTLDRFKEAQAEPRSGFDAALSEIRSGGKRGHWIWYVFPQLAGLGHSSASRAYGIDGAAEAHEYLRDPLLRSRLVTIASAVADQLARGVPLGLLMGSSIDATKLVSSLTLFGHVARRLDESEPLDDYASLARVADAILDAAAAAGVPPCRFTLDRLRGYI
jgi:uncharacterized protein (DUF1810 family)